MNKINGFLPKNSSTRAGFLSEILIEEFELVVTEEYKLEYQTISIRKARSNFWTVKTLMQRTPIDNSPIAKLSAAGKLKVFDSDTDGKDKTCRFGDI